ncbi:hypothetical protein PG997_012985 [Apiospora hydei]|uniref:C2H2-type domain-containing protein n=1 Tax=Apiospora hydei TaxID=1337664 RepID=A0ABR1V4W4_9PEZI
MTSTDGNGNIQQPALIRCPKAGCTWTTTSNDRLIRHVRGHEVVFKCPSSTCTMAFKRQDAMERHAWKAHGFNTIWICYYGGCKREGYGLSSKFRLEAHLAGHGISYEQNCELEKQAKNDADHINMASGSAVDGDDGDDLAEE